MIHFSQGVAIAFVLIALGLTVTLSFLNTSLPMQAHQPKTLG